MKEKNYTGLIPANTKGREITAEASAKLSNEDEARAFYERVKKKLLHVHNWQTITGTTLGADFQLTDDQGKDVDRSAAKGDHFRIDVSGPGSRAGKGYDWASVEDIKEINEDHVSSIAMLVRPAENPKTASKNTAHFFSKHSSSTFEVTRENNVVTASVYDRNIEANEETENVPDKFRNSVIGIAAKHGFSKMQWQALVDGLIRSSKERSGKTDRV
jgi:hypothetical protein